MSQQETLLLEPALLKNLPEVLDFLQKNKCETVGVLKFRLAKDGQVSDHLGPLNQLLADRLELSLLLRTSLKNPVKVIENASTVAAKTEGANHLTPAGREKLFAAKYPLAWGRDSVTPDALLTGLAEVTSGRKSLKVHIGAVLRSDTEHLHKVASFECQLGPGHLTDVGESFLRGVFDNGQVDNKGKEPEQRLQEQWTVVQDAAGKVHDQSATYPLLDPNAPVTLTVYYDNQKQPIEVRDGKAYLPEPGEGQQVRMVLRHIGKDRVIYGVVLKVNGENTLGRQRAPDNECRKWLLYPEEAYRVVNVDGFQIDDTHKERFRVLSAAESKIKEMNYGPDLGTMSITVFREWKNGYSVQPPPALSYDAEDVQILTRGLRPSGERPTSLAVLRHRLEKDARSRGLIDAGPRDESITQPENFRPDPVPVMSATIIYYRR